MIYMLFNTFSFITKKKKKQLFEYYLLRYVLCNGKDYKGSSHK